MAKTIKIKIGKKGSITNAITAKDLENLTIEPVEIIEASINDGLCNYAYEVKTGPSVGDKHTVKGKGLYYDELGSAFAAFNVHLALIDEVFKHVGMEVASPDAVANDEHTFLYTVSGFKVKKSGDVEHLILIGEKYVSSAGGRLGIVTHKIDLTKYSSYVWHEELKAVTDNARHEVARYMDGHSTPVEVEEKVSSKQMSILDNANEEGDELSGTNNDTELEDDFKSAVV